MTADIAITVPNPTQTLVGLFNFARLQAGLTAPIESTDDDEVGAISCRTAYPMIRQQTFEAVHWGSLERRMALTDEIEDEAKVKTTFSRAYRMENFVQVEVEEEGETVTRTSEVLAERFLYPRYLHDFTRFEIAGEVLFCDTEEPTLYYTADITEPGLWEPELYQCIGYALGAKIALPITKDRKIAEFAISEANSYITTARASYANRQQLMLRKQPKALSESDHRVPSETTSFIYPTTNALNFGR